MKKGSWSTISFCHLKGLRASTQTYRERGSVCVECLQILSQWWFVFVLFGVYASLSDEGGI